MDPLSELALEAARGRQVAWAKLVRATYPDVWRLCAHLVDRQAADDLSQETYLRAVRKLRRFRADGPVRSWLLTIARRVCAAEINDRQRRRDRALDFGSSWTPVDAGDHASRVELQLLLGALTQPRRDAFVLTQIIGCTYEEAAEICECPVGTIRSRVARARHDLIRAVDPGLQERPGESL